MIRLQNVLLTAAFAAALAVPVAGSAQSQPANTTATGQTARHRGGMMRVMRDLNLSAAQQAQIRQIQTQFRQAHPRGSAPDPQARKQMRSQIMNVLTPQQRQQLRANIRRFRRRAHRDGDRRGGAFAPSPTPTPTPGN